MELNNIYLCLSERPNIYQNYLNFDIGEFAQNNCRATLSNDESKE